MSAPFVMLGPDAQALINDVPYGVVSGSYRVTYEIVDRTDAATVTSKRHKQNPQRQVDVTLTAQRQSDVSPHTAPLQLTPLNNGVIGGQFHLVLWPNGLGDPFGALDVFLLAKTAASELNLSGSAPQTFTLEGVSDGDFFLPGE